ncbi:MAG: alpha/beta fold hydrolase [Candidatus Binatia bacterium]
MPHVDDNGVRLWYRVKGTGDPLVLSGGFGLLHNQFDYVVDMLAQEFQVIDWHYRGVGESDRAWVSHYSLDRWVNDLEVILSHLNITDAHLWGTSTGAPLSIRYAARYPQRVKSLIVYPSFKAGVATRKMFQVFLDITETFGYEALARFTAWIGCADQNVFSQVGNELALFEAAAFRRNFSIESLAKTLEVFSHIDLTSDVEKITVPTLLLLGDSGKLGGKVDSVSESVRLFRMHCPQTQVVQIQDGGGTYCMLEKPQETAQEVSRFIRQLRNQ